MGVLVCRDICEPQRELYIQLCLENVKNNVTVSPSILLLHAIV